MQLLTQHSPQVRNDLVSSTTANTAGIMADSMAMTVSHNPTWIINTGATNHMTSNLELLSKLSINKIGNHRTVQLPNRDETQVTHTGLIKCYI